MQDVVKPTRLEIVAVDGDIPISITRRMVDLAANAGRLSLTGCMFEPNDFNTAYQWPLWKLVLNRHPSTANLDAFGCFNSIVSLELNGVVGTPREGAASLSVALSGMPHLQKLVIVDVTVAGSACADVCHAMMPLWASLWSVRAALGHADNATRTRCMWALATLNLDFVCLRFQPDPSRMRAQADQNEE